MHYPACYTRIGGGLPLPDDHGAWEFGGTKRCDLWEFRDGYVTKEDTYWKFVG